MFSFVLFVSYRRNGFPWVRSMMTEYNLHRIIEVINAYLVGDKMQKKVLFCATVDGHILRFHTPYLKFFKDSGWEVHVASRGDSDIPFCDKKINIEFQRTPFSSKNIKAYRELKKVLAQNIYNIIHCHTPVGGALTRLAARKFRNKGTKVIYTAHGFHFYKGAHIKNWIFYYPIEKILSGYTDCLITLNEEDYRTAILNKFGSCEIKHVNGVGIDLQKFKPVSIEKRNSLRHHYGYKPEQFLLFYAAELNYNKNQSLLIKIIKELIIKIPQIRLLLAGGGALEKDYREMAKELKVEDNVDFLGHRKDIPELLSISDVVVASSKREGMPVNIMEAMASGKPIVATNIRGHRDLIVNGENCFLFELDDVEKAVHSIVKLYNSPNLIQQIGKAGIERVKKYSLDSVMKEMIKIYESFM